MLQTVIPFGIFGVQTRLRNLFHHLLVMPKSTSVRKSSEKYSYIFHCQWPPTLQKYQRLALQGDGCGEVLQSGVFWPPLSSFFVDVS
uniref:Uncharacterized protein n=1 Tax=Lepeophtheirus salmonis TaxID=72036 RepID=A0A0K2VHL7_LEPSM